MTKEKTLNKELSNAHGRFQEACMDIIFAKAEKLVKREKYKSLSEIDAIRYYLIQKHGWLPAQVKTMNIEDIVFCLEEEDL